MKISNIDVERIKTAKKLKINKKFTPCPAQDGDELFQNGIFVFNITRMLEYIESNSNEISLIEIEIKDFPECFSSIDESHIDSVDVSRPVIIAEISPGHYALIDGNHRKEKARRLGKNDIFAYKLNVEQHIKFLIDKDAYITYVKYWNEKLR